jgi:hypothetical protein
VKKGATVIGTIASTDKTLISAMTGNRVAHPLMLSMANIDMDFRMKASHHVLLLCALLPIAKFKAAKEFLGVLASRLFHSCLDFVFTPLKEAARIGVMMSDAFGRRRWCFTPLASKIVDTPESTMIAGVAASVSPVTTARYKQFGNATRRPPRTAAHTLALLKKIEAKARPWDLRKYLKLAKKEGLNGVHRPFWRDWPLSEPHKFLTPEILHHWLKMSWDHDIQWCILLLSATEIDRRFAALREHTGMRHFHEGISKAKQVTGREHRDIQRYLVAVVAEAEGVSSDFIIAIRSFVDFRYWGQAPKMGEDVLDEMDYSLKDFHKHKHAVLEAGVRRGKHKAINHWCIPKLELLQSVVPSIRANGVPIQWSADATEHAHITMIKNPVAHSNNRNHEQQICRSLDRLDKVIQFDLSTAMVGSGIDLGVPAYHPDDSEEDDDDGPTLVSTTSELLKKIEPATRLRRTRAIKNYFADSEELLSRPSPKSLRTWVSAQKNAAFHLSNCHVGRTLSIQDASELFHLPDLEAALLAYFGRASRGEYSVLGGRRQPSTDPCLPFQKLQVWHSVRLQTKSYHNPAQALVAETVNAEPPSAEWPFGRGDGVILNTDPGYVWPKSGLQGSPIAASFSHLI